MATATLLNHTFTKSRTNEFFKKSVYLIEEKHKDLNLDFIIDEVGNALIDGTDEQKRIMSRSLASAVWTVDWMLYAMSVVCLVKWCLPSHSLYHSIQQGTNLPFSEHHSHQHAAGVSHGFR